MRSRVAARFACLCALAFASSAAGQPEPQAPAVEWKLSTALGPAYPEGKAAEIWAGLIGERSGGRLHVKLFPGATLAQRDPAREFAALRDGAIDLAIGSAAAWANEVKELNVLALPWLVPDADVLDALLASDVAARLADAVQGAGVVPLAWANAGFVELASKRALHTPEDLRGLTLRVAASPLMVDTLLCLAARPVAMSAATALAAQRSGALDGELTSVTAYRVSRTYAVGLTHLLVWGAHADALLFAVNKSVWAGLSEADRELIARAAREAGAQASALSRRAADAEALAELARAGAQVTRLTAPGRLPFREASQPVYDRWTPLIGADLVRAAEVSVGAPR